LYTCLTSIAARARLRELKGSDPAFWSELTSEHSKQDLPPESQTQPEDELDETVLDLDDSDVPLPVVIKSIVDNQAPESYSAGLQGGFEAATMAEAFEISVRFGSGSGTFSSTRPDPGWKPVPGILGSGLYPGSDRVDVRVPGQMPGCYLLPENDQYMPKS